MGEAARRKANGNYPEKTSNSAAGDVAMLRRIAQEAALPFDYLAVALRTGVMHLQDPALNARVVAQLNKEAAKPVIGSQMLIGTTPATINARVQRFASTLSNEEPVYLPHTDVGEGYISGACHLNVAHRVKHHGGGRVFGWMIWASSVSIEGEFHAVWRSPEGQLMDVTPRVDGEELILFVPDPVTKVRQQGVGAHLPMNRPNPGGFGYREPDARTRAHMAKLGMAHYTGGEV